MSEEPQPSEPSNHGDQDRSVRDFVPASEEQPSRELFSPVDPSAQAHFYHGWNVWVSWLMIVGVIAFQVAMNQLDAKSDKEDTEHSVQIMDVQIEAKMALFLDSIEPSPSDDEEKPKSRQATSLITQAKGGSVQSRLARAIMLAYFGDFEGAEQAIKNLEQKIEETGYSPTKTQNRLMRITRSILDVPEPEMPSVEPEIEDESIEGESENGESLALASDEIQNDDVIIGQISADDRKFIVDEFGWIGELGLHLNSDEREAIGQRMTGMATRSFIGIGVLGGIGILWALAGLVAGGVLVIWVLSKGFLSRFEGQPQRSVVYLETFAIWMVVLVGSQIFVALAARILSGQDGNRAEVMSWAMHMMPVAFLGSLFVLVWPVFRGISFGEMRRDIGWYGNPIVESFWGLCGHLASFLFLLAGFLTTIGIVVLLNSLKPATDELAGIETMGHPIQEAMGGQFSLILAMFFLTVVCAPIVEETFFRGVFYRYLRDLRHGSSLVFRIAFAVIVNSFVFAAIHPQGIAGVPVLTALAVVMSLIRENRGSLWGSMAVHAVHNFFVTMMAFTMLS